MVVNIVLIAVLVLSLIIGFSCGFFRQLVGYLGGFVALILAFVLCKPVANIIFNNTGWATSLAERIANALHLPTTMVEANNVSSAVAGLTLPSFVKTSAAELALKFEQGIVNVGFVVSTTIARYIIIILCFIVLFIVLKLLSKLLKRVASGVKDLPIIGIVDRILGALFGIIRTLLLIYSVILLIQILPFGFLTSIQQAIDASSVASFLTKYNLFVLIFSALVI